MLCEEIIVEPEEIFWLVQNFHHNSTEFTPGRQTAKLKISFFINKFYIFYNKISKQGQFACTIYSIGLLLSINCY